MISKIVVIILFATSAFANNEIDSIYSYRSQLCELAKSCQFWMPRRPCTKCKNPELNYLCDISNSTLKVWQDNYKAVSLAILVLAHQSRHLDKNNSTLINDSSVVACLSYLLASKDTVYQHNVYDCLISNTPYFLLEMNNKIIINSLSQSYLNELQKDSLIALCNPPNEIKEILLKNGKISRALRARLGDTIAQKNIISDLNNQKDDFYKAQSLIQECSICGTPECIKCMLNQFNKPIYIYGNNKRIRFSIRVPIIKELQKYNPTDSLVTFKYEEMTGAYWHMAGETDDTVEVSKYLSNLIQLFEKKYNFKPEGEIGKKVFKNEREKPDKNDSNIIIKRNK